MTRVISKHFEPPKKCNGCNWPVTVHYSFTSNPIDEEGLCGDCFMEMIVENKWDIGNNEHNKMTSEV